MSKIIIALLIVLIILVTLFGTLILWELTYTPPKPLRNSGEPVRVEPIPNSPDYGWDGENGTI